MLFALHGCLFIIATRLIVSLLLKRRQKGFLSRRPIPNSSRMTSRSFPPETNPPSHVVQWDRGLIETYKISPHERFAVKSGPHFMAIITSKHGRCAMAMLGVDRIGNFPGLRSRFHGDSLGHCARCDGSGCSRSKYRSEAYRKRTNA